MMMSVSQAVAVAVVAVMAFAFTLPAAASAFPSGLPPGGAPATTFPNPWAAFQNLSGCHKGEEREGLAGLKDYLSHFGYLPPPPSSSPFSDAFDHELESAIATYQRNFGLNATGALDPSTVSQMVAPRCGVADVINGTSTMSRSSSSSPHGRHLLYAYFPGGPTWPAYRRDLRYAITATSATSIDRPTLSAVFARAFARWAAATNLRFEETTSASGEADITIGFYAGAHGDGEPFDGPLGTLAHAFSPTDGRFHLDAAEAWVAGTGTDVTRSSAHGAVDLESVAVHEIGHLLGLGHSSVPEAIMYPTIRTGTRKVELEDDDVQGIQSLYGSNPNFTPASPATSSREMDSGGAGAGCRRPDRVFVGLGVVAAVGLLLVLVP